MSTSNNVVELEVRGVVVGLFRENCWVVGSRRRGEGVVIDPGDEPGEILALARDLGVRITRILASHAHLDHIMAARAVQEATAAPFLLHAADQQLAESLPEQTARLLGESSPPPPAPAELLRGGEDLEVAGTRLRVLHTPGHTPGSVSLYVPDAGLLFSGDTLFSGTIGRTDLPGGSYEQIMGSIVSELMALPDQTRVLPGHMQETTIGAERARNPFILAALGKGPSPV